MLSIATEAEKQARDALTAEVWGGGLTLAQFLERERVLRSHPWAARTLTTFLWKDANGEVLGSCESFLDHALVGSREGTASTIASVFVEPRLRGRNIASKMLGAVIEHLRATPGCLAVTLYSEIGTALYQRLGFWPVPAFDTFFPARGTGHETAQSENRAPLDEPGVNGTAPERRVSGEGVMLPAPRHAPGDAATLRLELSSQRLDWQLARERVYTAALGKKPLQVHGAQVGESTITWTAYWKTNELQLLSLDLRDPAHAEPLLAAARDAAHQVGLPVVRAWETVALSHLPDARRVPRTDEIAMFLPLAPGLQAWTQVERGLWA